MSTAHSLVPPPQFNDTGFQFIAIIPPIHLQPVERGNVTLFEDALSGFQAFCSEDALQQCGYETAAYDCPACNVPLYGFFMTLVALFGAVVLLGNSVIIWTVGRKKKTTKFEVLKVSLAIADILTGIQMIAISIPNIAWSLHSTGDDMLNAVTSSFGSSAATSGGIFFVLGFTASLFNLLLLSAQRLYAVRFPMRYKLQSKITVLAWVGLIWAVGLFAACVPALFPDIFLYSYNHVLFLYYPTLTLISPDVDFAPAIILMVFSYALPYLVMLSLVVATAIYIRVFLRKSRNLAGLDSHRRTRTQVMRREAAVFKTVSIMIVGFTITLLPLLGVVSAFYGGSLTTSNYSQPYLIAFYLAMTSSLVNLLVYCIRNNNYRAAIRRSLCFYWDKHSSESSNTTSGNTQQQRPTQARHPTEKTKNSSIRETMSPKQV